MYLENWIENKKGSVENNTFKSYETLVKNHIMPHFESLKLKVSEVKPRHIMAFYELKSKSGRLDGKSGGVSHRVLKYFSTIFCQVFKKAILDEIIENNPSINVPIPKNENRIKVGEFLESDEAQKLINLFNNHLLYPIMVTALYYGFRRSEILGLKWDSINFESNVIEIKHTVLRYGKDFEERDRTKNLSSRRSLGLIPEIKKLFLKVKEQQEKNKALFGSEYINSKYIFTKLL